MLDHKDYTDGLWLISDKWQLSITLVLFIGEEILKLYLFNGMFER